MKDYGRDAGGAGQLRTAICLILQRENVGREIRTLVVGELDLRHRRVRIEHTVLNISRSLVRLVCDVLEGGDARSDASAGFTLDDDMAVDAEALAEGFTIREICC